MHAHMWGWGSHQSLALDYLCVSWACLVSQLLHEDGCSAWVVPGIWLYHLSPPNLQIWRLLELAGTSWFLQQLTLWDCSVTQPYSLSVTWLTSLWPSLLVNPAWNLLVTVPQCAHPHAVHIRVRALQFVALQTSGPLWFEVASCTSMHACAHKIEHPFTQEYRSSVYEGDWWSGLQHSQFYGQPVCVSLNPLPSVFSFSLLYSLPWCFAFLIFGHFPEVSQLLTAVCLAQPQNALPRGALPLCCVSSRVPWAVCLFSFN